VSGVHEIVGYLVVGLFTVGWMFGLFLWISRRQAGDWFWRWLTVAQVVAIAQALLGAIVFLVGGRPTTWLHYVYGFGPLVIFAIAHVLARDDVFRAKPWAPFALASFISFGLSLRALTTGLGIG
jgi:hypothetical protein